MAVVIRSENTSYICECDDKAKKYVKHQWGTYSYKLSAVIMQFIFSRPFAHFYACVGSIYIMEQY